jgi:2-polyprenyl-3-methyl-5-hydroxy-6-metoxy-1,4-benzoquinol methylase
VKKQKVQHGSDGPNDISGYRFDNADLNHAHGFLLPALFDLLDSLNLKPEKRRIFELGCGNASVTDQLTRKGFDVTGVDPSEEIGRAHV